MREAVASHRDKLIVGLRAHVAEMHECEAAGDLQRVSRIDMNFHYEFLACCPNPYLRAAYDLIRYQLIALRHRSPIDNMVDSHQVLIDFTGGGRH